MPQLSVIIPIYNREQYLSKCVRSLFAQTLADIEYIFVDDASTDGSMEILQTELAKYPQRQNVQIIRNQQNFGIAATRTIGLQAATGKYIGWCDSDDWVDPEMFGSMLQTALRENADIVVCGFTHEYADHTEYCPVDYPERGIDYLATLYTRCTKICFLWNKIFRRELFITNLIFPYEGINISEDINMSYRAMYYAQRVTCMPQYFYHHLNSPHGSLSQSDRQKELWQQNKRNDLLLCDFLQSKDPEIFQRSCDFIKFMSKAPAQKAFDSDREYFDTFRESHRSIMAFTAFPLWVRIKMRLVFSIYPLYCLYRLLKK